VAPTGARFDPLSTAEALRCGIGFIDSGETDRTAAVCRRIYGVTGPKVPPGSQP
jgi:hypothetical protein